MNTYLIDILMEMKRDTNILKRLKTKDDVSLLIRENTFGYGYELIAVTEGDNKSYSLLHHSYDLEEINNIAERIAEEGIENVSVSHSYNEEEVHKVLICEYQGRKSCYYVPTVSRLLHAMRMALRERYRGILDMIEPERPENKIGFSSYNDIEGIPDGLVKEIAKQKYEEYLVAVHDYEKRMRKYENLKKVVTLGTGNTLSAMRDFHIEPWSVEELIDIK